MRMKTVDETNFEREVLEADIPVLVYFWGKGCGPWEIMEATLEEVAVALEGKVKVVKMNVDENPDHAEEFTTGFTPTLAFFMGGELIRFEEPVIRDSRDDPKTEILNLTSRKLKYLGLA
ncbi:thioredoxin family protein [Rhizobium leguminosarum]|uniref:thioredoxin family protein n=1 Tax=Rhizobium leguminosarum TaxID=384 RepID=UPI001AE39563|nr:thioredoxin domain-containing protein [Rhizobium leguminosarum]MBP2444202.1 thioredoxin 1 [Rhizobium leguminosarum]